MAAQSRQAMQPERRNRDDRYTRRHRQHGHRGRSGGRPGLRAGAHAPLGRPPHGGGGAGDLPGRQVRDRSRHRARLLLRLRSAAPADAGRSRGDRARMAANREKARTVRARGGVARGSAAHLRRQPLQGRADRGSAPGRDHHDLPAGRLPRSLPRSARAQHGRDRTLQAPLDRRRLLAWRREAADAAAHLRHGLADTGRSWTPI